MRRDRIIKRHRRKRRIVRLCVLFAFMALVWLNNTSLFVHNPAGSPKLLAHRGLAQTFDVADVDANTNTAAIIYPPTHEYIENTIASMRAAFDGGADVVEFDIQLTKDSRLAVFHDSELSYRTDGTGRVSDYTMEELKTLDIGYGYTADGGKTYPFRGQGVGLMPSVDEVFATFPNEDFLIHIKTNDIEAARILWSYLSKMDEPRLTKITVYGSNAPIAYLRLQSPTLRLMSAQSMKKALLEYMAVGWTGYIPASIRNTEIHLPQNYARWLWGWPDTFIVRMERVNTRVVLVNGTGGFSEGFDDAAALEAIPEGFTGYIWTNSVEVVSPLVE